MSYEMPVTGTHIWYYYICKREVWLMVHQIAPDQDHEYLDYGRFLADNRYNRSKKEISIGNIVVDRLKTKNGQLIVGEVKKSSKYLKSAKMQLLFYLSSLRKMGIDAKGELLFPEERKKEVVEWSIDHQHELEQAIEDIRTIAKQPIPPKREKISFCKSCAYREYCWAEE